MINLRSDTITIPTAPLRQAIAQAAVGDDVFGEDPTVNQLQQRTAEVLGKQAALYMPSGTMTNQVAVRTHTQGGDEIITEATSHIYLYEAGATAALSGVICKTLQGQRGIFTADQLEAALRLPDQHFPPTRLVCVENTHNRGGGSIWSIDRIAQVAEVARKHGLHLHLDGARLWNAAAATGISEKQYAEYFDSVSVCFSKGLGAPVGSALAGSRAFIDRAHRFRKQFGGGMRQAGIIAAGALYALENHRDRLVEDHANAQTLAQALASVEGIEVDPNDVETNIVRVVLTEPISAQVAEEMARRGVQVLALEPNSFRAVTNLHISREDITEASQIIADAVDVVRGAVLK